MRRKWGAPLRAMMVNCEERKALLPAFEHQQRIDPHVEPRRVTVGCDSNQARRCAR
jgi:hypothetical protein